MNWYYKIGDSKVGPVSDRQMQELAELGKITRETMVWNEVDTRWQPFGQISGKTLAESLNRQSPSEEDTSEIQWDAQTDSTSTEHYGAASDIEAAVPAPTSYCSRCFKKFADEELVRYGAEKFCPTCETLYSKELKKTNASPRLPLAGFCLRMVAKLIDWVIMGIIGMLLYATAVFLLLWTDAIFMAPVRITIFVIVYISWLISFLGYAAFFVGNYGATPGKLALGLKVVDADGGKIGYIKALGRCCAEIVSGIPLAVGYFMAAFDAEKRTLHDRICGTRVITKPARGE